MRPASSWTQQRNLTCRLRQGCSRSTQNPGISHPVRFCSTKPLFHSSKASTAFTFPQEASQEERFDGVSLPTKKSPRSWWPAAVYDVEWSDVGRATATKSSEEGSIVHKDTCPCPGANSHPFSEPTALPRAFLLGVVLLRLHKVENHRGGHFKTKVGHVWGSSCFFRLSCPVRFQPSQVFSGQGPGGPSCSLAICCRGVAVALTEQAKTRGLATPSVRVPFAVFQLKLNPVSTIPVSTGQVLFGPWKPA